MPKYQNIIINLLMNRTRLTATLLFIVLLGSTNAFAQKSSIILTFTAMDGSEPLQLDSLKVMNRTQGGDTVLYWPDNVLNLHIVGVHEQAESENTFKVFQNYPNPVSNHTTISIFVPEKDLVRLRLSDPSGRILVATDKILDKGMHFFEFTPGSGNITFCNAQWRGKGSGITILSNGLSAGTTMSLAYSGTEVFDNSLKVLCETNAFSFSPGDLLLFIGYAGSQQSGDLDRPEQSQSYSLQFATNIPCEETPVITYEGQVYNTIQIFNQCWLKENLNVGTMVSGTEEMVNNGITEKYCFNDEADSCSKYGGLYQWDELMQYTLDEGVRGICPEGWHVPSDEEWKLLEGAVDSQYKIGDPIWDLDYEFRGFDAAKNLKTTTGWGPGPGGDNSTDLFGFSALPGSYRKTEGVFYGDIRYVGYWWTSSKDIYTENAWGRYMYYTGPMSPRSLYVKERGLSVRCLKD